MTMYYLIPKLCLYYIHINIYMWVQHRSNQWQPTPVLLPGKSHGRRSLVGCSPWGRQESDTTEQLHFHFSLSCIGEGNSNPLQCFCLENPRDGGAWWAAISGVAQSWTRLKQLSSSNQHVNFLLFVINKSRFSLTEKQFCNIYILSIHTSGVSHLICLFKYNLQTYSNNTVISSLRNRKRKCSE